MMESEVGEGEDNGEEIELEENVYNSLNSGVYIVEENNDEVPSPTDFQDKNSPNTQPPMETKAAT